MLPSGRELRQQMETFRTVNAIHNSSAEPQDPAIFTRLQLQSKVVHVCSPRHSYPLASLHIFQRSEGLTQVAMRHRSSIREALLAPSARSRHLFVCPIHLFTQGKDFHVHPCSSTCALRGVSRSSAAIFPPAPLRTGVSRLYLPVTTLSTIKFAPIDWLFEKLLQTASRS
jgi:hypothetical protein